MNTMKVKKRFNFFKHIDRKGMTMLEFIFTFMLVFTIVAIFIQIGFFLRCEAVVIGATKALARKVEVSGTLTQGMVNDMEAKLNNSRITNGRYKLIYDGRDDIVFQPGGNRGTEDLPFRKEFKIGIRSNFNFKNIVNIPLTFVANGKVERFKYQ